jgi:hypothetical protein
VNDSGTVLYEHSNLAAFESVKDTIDLETGCYTMLINDNGCDGLSFFANNAGNGRIWLHPGNGENFFPAFHQFNPNFGCDQTLSFTVGYVLGQNEIDEATLSPTLVAYPNPTNGSITLAIENANELGNIVVYNQAGQMVKELKLNKTNGVVVEGLSAGVYFAKYEDQSSSSNVRFVVIR